jgi:hypothetical protein
MFSQKKIKKSVKFSNQGAFYLKISNLHQNIFLKKNEKNINSMLAYYFRISHLCNIQFIQEKGKFWSLRTLYWQY